MILALIVRMGVRPTKVSVAFFSRHPCLTVGHKPTDTTFLSQSFTHTPLFLSLHRSFKFQWKISVNANNIIQTNSPNKPWMILALTFKMGVRPLSLGCLFSPVTHVWLFGHSSSSSSSKGRLGCVTHIHTLRVWHKPTDTTFISIFHAHTTFSFFAQIFQISMEN